MPRHYKALELDKILELLAGHTGSEDGRKLALSLRPCESYEEAMQALERTGAAHALTNRFGTPSVPALNTPQALLSRARVGASLSMGELLEVAYILQTARVMLGWQRQWQGEENALTPLFFMLRDNRELEEAITRSILSPDEMADTASPELGDIRRKIRQAQLRTREQLDKLVRSGSTGKYLQEQLVTLRNGRFVVPVKAEHRGEIKGLVHDTSSSGATLFVEPLAVVEANNQIRELESKEQHEIARILLALSGQVAGCLEDIRDDYDALVQLDVQFAKSRLADHMKATLPVLGRDGKTQLKKARHPLIPAASIVPIDIMIGGEFDTLVITGPNTGGKTVALKTLGLLSLMAMCGLMIPAAEECPVSFFEKVLVDIGDEQSIEQSLSTFSGHMTNIIAILAAADSGSLVLIDELGAGTDPVEGAALAVAIITSLREKGARIAATTHYPEIKLYALQTPGVENGSCEFDVATLRPTYRLLIGIPGRSNAFAISQRLGLPEDIIEKAKELVSGENTRFEDVVSSLEEARLELEKEKEQARRYRMEADEAKQIASKMRQSLEKSNEQELERARAQARSIVEQTRFASQQLLDELDDLKKEKDKKEFSAAVTQKRGSFKGNLRKLEELADPVTRKKSSYRLPRPIRRGDLVQMADTGTRGTVLSEPDSSGQVQVQAGIMKLKVPLESLRLLEKEGRVSVGGGAVNTRRVVGAAKEDSQTEADLRGMTSDEALMELDRAIDKALLSNIKLLTVIHGKGTGVLRKAVHQRLKQHRLIKSYRLGVYGEGESGVTIVEFK
ncbi:endonuclease MutS2 [Oscillospiraceae bacterium MB08-C2-2]|nr:endonuclease MutS2 [Oscillospiraceae bacterium MB08-C2-2]